MIDVDIVEPDRALDDPNLARAGVTDFDRFPAQGLGAAGLMHANGMGHEQVSSTASPTPIGPKRKAPPGANRAGP